MKDKQKTPCLRQGSGANSTDDSDVNDISIIAQRQRLLAELRRNSITTIHARSELNILAPAARIWELRHKEGLNIVKSLVKDITSEGHEHRVAQYSLLKGKWDSVELQGGDEDANA